MSAGVLGKLEATRSTVSQTAEKPVDFPPPGGVVDAQTSPTPRD